MTPLVLNFANFDTHLVQGERRAKVFAARGRGPPRERPHDGRLLELKALGEPRQRLLAVGDLELGQVAGLAGLGRGELDVPQHQDGREQRKGAVRHDWVKAHDVERRLWCVRHAKSQQCETAVRDRNHGACEIGATARAR